MLPSSRAFRMFRLIVVVEDKFAAAFSEILPYCLPLIRCTVSCVVFALDFMPILTFITLTCVGPGTCVWSLTCSTN